MTLQALRGTTDLLADDVDKWIAIEQQARRISRLYGYQEIRTPLIEDAALFLRSLGETTDIVQKEMFRFEDRGGNAIVLRPEGTAPVVRAYLEHHLHKTQGFAKLFYLGPMFRAERPQAGRFRQFHQYGVEAIGSQSAWVDVEVIILCLEILRACGVQDVSLWIGSMGCRDDQKRSASLLRERLHPQIAALCKDCQGRLERNVFRVLDCKHPTCQGIIRELMSTMGQKRLDATSASPFVLCEACKDHFDTVRSGLKDAQVVYDDSRVFARGLDYYTRTVFEIRAQGLGAQDAVAAGGRYDHLVEEFGGPSLGAVGFATGMERLLLAASRAQDAAIPSASRQQTIFLAVAQPELIRQALRMAQQLRNQHVPAYLDYEGRSLKAQLREADQLNCHWVAIIGNQELQQGVITLKDLGQGTQDAIPLERFVETMVQRLHV